MFFLLMEPHIEVIGEAKLGKDMEFKNGLMEHFMREIGSTMSPTGKESLLILMGISIKEYGRMEKLTDMEYLWVMKEENTKDIGKMI